MDLHIPADELSRCVQCGLCLPHCPTFRVSGDESQSPRGRIALMRAVQDGGAPVTGEVRAAWESCVQCRGCETACPSGVHYGLLMELTRESLADARIVTPRWQRAGFTVLRRPRVLRAASRVLAAAQRVGLVPARLGLPRLPLRAQPLRTSGYDVHLVTGCVMDAWQRDVHRDTQQVLEAAGFGVHPTGDAVPCCGALHVHAGLGDPARAMASQAIAAIPGDAPILVDSAGCGAAMKDYGNLLGTEEARRFAARVHDVGEWLAGHLDRLPDVDPLALRVAVQDPCHLRHVQRVHHSTRTVLAPYVRDLVELDDEGLCCGAGGAYSLLQPAIAGRIRDRKVSSIARATPDVVASANPGCAMHLAGAGVPTVHPMTLIARALDGRGYKPPGGIQGRRSCHQVSRVDVPRR
ncbi:4Fe-4S dicluster domain-containing protein [Acidiferrimicrobium sp. IK]|uniref:(Fe-S)-binding protein n=1 Tax=Acidiferrimicrobium sp. IK TaxID=2871700 RepID=UPI0021CB654F|nr:heterodisulfide reductase-related iron-sulfur binding cluster [Acidiferrimicrobium sp. IK]MCU4184434.1 4Fe-4S dicluster domain-containing protein [Acidiferrimicrobium sp. IK]